MSQTPNTSGAPLLHSSVTLDAEGRKTWHFGTLSYTMRALVLLFVLLLMGDFAWSMRDRSVGEMSKWYLNSLKVPAFWFGILFSTFPAFIGLILGPIISVRSDRHRGKRGRRVPFLLVTTPIAAFGMLGLGFTPVMVNALHDTLLSHGAFGSMLQSLLTGSAFGENILHVLANPKYMAVAFFGLFWTCFEFATIAGQSVFGGLINDVVPRPFLGRFYGFFRAVSLIDGIIFNYWLMGMVPTYFTIIMVSIGVFYGVAFMWVCFRVKEGQYPPPEPREAHPITGKAGGWGTAVKSYFKESFSNPYYIAVFIMMMTAGLSFGPVNIFSIPYARSLNIDMKVYGHYIALTYVISLTLSFFLGWLADKFHPLRMAIFTLVGYFVVTTWGSFYARTPDTFLLALVLHGVLSGCYFTGAATLGQRLFPHSKFAQFGSAAGILSAFGGMILGPAVGQVIDVSGKVYRLTFSIAAGITITALIAAIFVYWRFMKLGGDEHYVAPGEGEIGFTPGRK